MLQLLVSTSKLALRLELSPGTNQLLRLGWLDPQHRLVATSKAPLNYMAGLSEILFNCFQRSHETFARVGVVPL